MLSRAATTLFIATIVVSVPGCGLVGSNTRAAPNSPHCKRWALPTRQFGRVAGLVALRKAVRTELRARSSKVKLVLPVPTGSVLRGGNTSAFHSVSLAVPRDRRAERYIIKLLAAKLAGHRVLGTQLLAAAALFTTGCEVTDANSAFVRKSVEIRTMQVQSVLVETAKK